MLQNKLVCVAAVIITRNRCELLKQCIHAVLSQTYECDILVVDNGSTDETSEWLDHMKSDRIHHLRLEMNVGGSGGYNLGMRWCIEHKYDLIWTMDDDCIPQKDALEKLLDAGNVLHNDFAFLASTVLWTDGSVCKMNKQKPIADHKLYSNISIVHQATFVSCLFQSNAIRKYGLPIKEFFICADDVELTRRIAVRGHEPCYWVKDSIVVHAMATNNGSVIATDTSDRLDRYSYAYRNENYLYRQEGIKGFAYYTLRITYHILLIILKAKDKRIQRMGIILKQYFVGLRFNPEVEMIEKQSRIQRLGL